MLSLHVWLHVHVPGSDVRHVCPDHGQVSGQTESGQAMVAGWHQSLRMLRSEQHGANNNHPTVGPTHWPQHHRYYSNNAAHTNNTCPMSFKLSSNPCETLLLENAVLISLFPLLPDPTISPINDVKLRFMFEIFLLACLSC